MQSDRVFILSKVNGHTQKILPPFCKGKQLLQTGSCLPCVVAVFPHFEPQRVNGRNTCSRETTPLNTVVLLSEKGSARNEKTDPLGNRPLFRRELFCRKANRKLQKLSPL